LSDVGSSPASSIRRSSSRHESPASTRILVVPDAIRVEFPFDPEAKTVIRTN
jgi:hypothetical protein